MNLAFGALSASPLCHPDVGVAGAALPGCMRVGAGGRVGLCRAGPCRGAESWEERKGEYVDPIAVGPERRRPLWAPPWDACPKESGQFPVSSSKHTEGFFYKNEIRTIPELSSIPRI